jgi:flavin reductase (DIM6/NTAB) family NADH-FMN oxidoreductase RutF
MITTQPATVMHKKLTGNSLRKKPWNRVNLPVYSISSKWKDEKNMHLITYAMQAGMKPKCFVCSIYKGTKTLELVEKSGEFVLQLLSASQYRVIDLLGKKSGNNMDKIARLMKRNLLQQWQGFNILKESLAVMHLKVTGCFDAGDHTCFLCECTGYKNLNHGKELTLDVLRKHKLVRI